MCTWTSSTIRWGILQNIPLKGSSSTILISCFAKYIHPNSPGYREKMSWYSVNKAQTATQFLSDPLSRLDKSSCWKSTLFLCSTTLLVCWIPCISSNFSRVLGVTFTGGTAFAATTWATLMSLVIVIEVAVRFSLPLQLACSQKFSVCVHYAQAVRQVGSITPFQGLSHYIHVASQEQGFHLAICYLGWKSTHFSLLCCFDHLIQVS